MGMEIRLYRAFTTAARHSTFGAAAAELALSQPALTKQIQMLEREVGAPLFLRGRHGAQLTSTGRQLLPDAIELVARADRLSARMRGVASGTSGHLAIGFGLSSIAIAPAGVAAFRKAFPGVAVTLEDHSSSEQIDLLRQGQLDFGFVRLPFPDGLAGIAVASDRLALARPAVAEVPAVAAHELGEWLEGHDLVALTAVRGPGLAAQIALLLDQLDCRVTVVQQAADLQTVLALVAAGVGGALVPASAVSVAPAGVVVMPITEPETQWGVGLVWNPEAASPLSRAFVDAVVASHRVNAHAARG